MQKVATAQSKDWIWNAHRVAWNVYLQLLQLRDEYNFLGTDVKNGARTQLAVTSRPCN